MTMAVTVRAAPPAHYRPRGRRSWIPVLLAAVTIGCEIAYPLVHGDARTTLTIATVCAFAAASVSHAAISRGPGAATALLLIAGGIGFAVEAIAVRTGWPFGDYAYSDQLGFRLLDVPVVIALAWVMMTYPALLAARRLVRSRAATALVAGVALATWDLFLDPMMVDAGHWRWANVTHHLPGISDVPLSNFVGWLVVAVAVMTVLDRMLPRGRGDGVPYALYLWTYASSVLANAFFFDRPAVAVTGGLAMGVVAVPLAMSLLRR